MDMPTKVCHITSVHSRYDGRIFLKECTSLAKAGYDVTLLVADGGERETKNGVQIVPAAKSPASRVKRLLTSGKRMRNAAFEIDADIYHLHDPELLPLAKKLKKAGKKVIFDSHEKVTAQILGKEWIPRVLRGLISFTYGLYERHVFKRMDCIITVSPPFVEELRTMNSKTELITNYPIIDAPVDETAEKYEEHVFVYAGGISAQWNHEVILDALENVPAKFLLMGGGDESYLDALKKNPSWDKVVYLGKVPHGEVAGNLRKCAAGLALLAPSPNTSGKTGTMGNTKLFEYMYAGLPLICTDFILWQEIIDKWHCGICVSPDRAKEVQNAMRCIIDNPDEARRMGENGRRAVLTEFNWGIEEKKLLELYRGLLDGRRWQNR